MAERKPRVLIITQHYLPGWKTGGPVRSIANMIEHLGDAFEFRVLTSDRDLGDQVAYPHITEGISWYPQGKALVKYLAPSQQAFWPLLKEIRAVDYDLLYVNGLLPNFSVFAVLGHWLKLLPVKPVIIAPRGHLEVGALSIKSRKKQYFLTVAKALSLYKRVLWHAASENERDDILRMLPSIKPGMITVVPNLPTSLINSTQNRILKQSGCLKLVFFSRVSRKKNLDFALTVLSNGIAGEVEFDIYGPIEDELYWAQCQQQIAALPSDITVRYCGAVNPDDVQGILSQYHLFFLPTRGENFGHVIYEALAAGCPVLISDQTPWNSVNQHGAGWAISLEHPQRFRDCISRMVLLDDSEWREYQQAARHFSSQYTAKSRAVEDMRAFLSALAN